MILSPIFNISYKIKRNISPDLLKKLPPPKSGGGWEGFFLKFF